MGPKAKMERTTSSSKIDRKIRFVLGRIGKHREVEGEMRQGDGNEWREGREEARRRERQGRTQRELALAVLAKA
jgi:hypothetical protein